MKNIKKILKHLSGVRLLTKKCNIVKALCRKNQSLLVPNETFGDFFL